MPNAYFLDLLISRTYIVIKTNKGTYSDVFWESIWSTFDTFNVFELKLPQKYISGFCQYLKKTSEYLFFMGGCSCNGFFKITRKSLTHHAKQPHLLEWQKYAKKIHCKQCLQNLNLITCATTLLFLLLMLDWAFS